MVAQRRASALAAAVLLVAVLALACAAAPADARALAAVTGTAAAAAASSSAATAGLFVGARRKLMQWGRGGWGGGGWGGGGWGGGGGYPFYGGAYAGEVLVCFLSGTRRTTARSKNTTPAPPLAASRSLPRPIAMMRPPLTSPPPPPRTPHHQKTPTQLKPISTGPFGSCATGVGGYACNLGGSGRSSASAISGGSALAAASTPKANAVAGGGRRK